MSESITINNLSKRYKLGLTHAGSIRELANGLVRRVFRRDSVAVANASQGALDSTRVEDGHFWALNDVNFSVAQGEAIGIIGKNGAGKSTLLKILSQITRPTSGRAVLRGRVASLLEVGTGFHPELTGRENVYLNGTILGMRKKEITRQLDSIVEFAGVDKFLDTPVKRYSSGMMVRLGFAVAAHLDPEILIVDEVLAVGDVEFQRRCLSKMQNVADSGKTVLFVSHNLASIRILTKRTIVLSEGKLIYDGPSENGIANYVQLNLAKTNSISSIADMPRSFSGLDRNLEFVDVQLTGLGQDGVWLSHEPFALAATIRANRDCDDFIIGLSIFSEDKTPVGSTFSLTIPSPASNTAEIIELMANIPLAPGRYHCAISLSNAKSEGRHLHDSLADILPFQVAMSAADVRGWNAAWGFLRLPLLQMSRRSGSC